MSRPRLLDLFCCAGGAATGYARAGFDVLGVDVRPQPNYPFRFVQTDAIAYATSCGSDFDAIHASPPCQAHTTMSNRWRGKGGAADAHADLIAATRAVLIASGKPYILENVVGATRMMVRPITLTGGMFGLGVHRPRLFESNVPLVPPAARLVVNPVGVYGRHHDGRRLFTRKDGTIQRCASTLEEGQEAMGIGWMTWPELTEAIPPDYTEYLGAQLLRAVQRRAAA